MNLYRYGPMVAGALPEWNKVTHPFGFMAENAVMEGAFALYISDGPFIYDTANGVIVPTEGAEVLRATWYTDKWSDFVLSESAELLVAQWATVDIETDAGGVFLAAEPIVLYDAPLIITHDVTVDMMMPSMPSVVHAVQDDQYSRDLRLTILCGGVPWVVPTGSKVTVRFLKPDKTGGNYDTMPDGSDAFTIEENRVTVKLAPQVLTVEGDVLLCIRIESGGTKINTFYAKIDVQANPGITAASTNFFKLTGTLADAGWAPNMILGTDENGNVIAVENPVDRMEELVAGINAALDELIGEEVTE